MSEHEHEGVLLAEHELLGAEMSLAAYSDIPVALSYANETPFDEALRGVALTDLTGAVYLLASGASAQGLVECACAGRRLTVGECAFEATLTGDGALVSVPFLARTGDAEYVALDLSPRGEALAEWLSFLAGVKGEGGQAFPDVSMEDATQLLVPLLAWGEGARGVLSDYLPRDVSLPGVGGLASVMLDRIPAVIARVPLPPESAPCYLVLVPPARARVLWRSLLSFDAVHPIGHRALAGGLSKRLPWWKLLETQDVVRTSRSTLSAWDTLRGDGGFVGLRGLKP